jgi:hypothetical protein
MSDFKFSVGETVGTVYGKRTRVVKHIRLGSNFPYELNNGKFYKESSLIKKGVVKKTVSNILEKFEAAKRTHEERLLIRHGLTDEKGNLTQEGSALKSQLEFEGTAPNAVKAKMVEIAQKIEDEEKGPLATKSKKDK